MLLSWSEIATTAIKSNRDAYLSHSSVVAITDEEKTDPYSSNSLWNFAVSRAGAGNAVQIGDSGAAVTGYETSEDHPEYRGRRGVGLKPEVRTTARATILETSL